MAPSKSDKQKVARTNKWVSQLRASEGAVDLSVDVFRPDNMLRSTSPGLNWLFGKNHGLPFGYSMLLWGLQKAGKSFISNSFIAGLHRDYPEAIAVKFNTEFRDGAQLTPQMISAMGIDIDRYVGKEGNSASFVFDYICDDINQMCKDGAPIKLIIIDSQNGIRGRREQNQESVEQHQMGDHAATMKVGLKRVLEVQRRWGIAMIITSHSTPEMDAWEQKRGNKNKAAVAQGVLHHCEYFVNVERNLTAAGKKDELEREFVDTSKKDLDGKDGKAEFTGHKILGWMQNSSFGSSSRVAEFTIDYRKGVVNQHEEVFRLGNRWGLIKRPSNAVYEIGERKFNGKPACLAALANEPALQQQIIHGLIEAERLGTTSMEQDEDEIKAAFDRMKVASKQENGASA